MAQEFRGRVQGVVTDATGAVAPGATLTLRNTGTNVESTRTSNDQGRYVFDYVDPGTYVLSAELAGFLKWIQQNKNNAVPGCRYGLTFGSCRSLDSMRSLGALNPLWSLDALLPLRPPARYQD